MPKSRIFAFSVLASAPERPKVVSSCLNCSCRCFSLAAFNGRMRSVDGNSSCGKLILEATEGVGCGGVRKMPVSIHSRFGKFAMCILGKICDSERERITKWLTSMGHVFSFKDSHNETVQLVSTLMARREDVIFGMKSVLRDVRGDFALFVLIDGKIYVALSSGEPPELWAHTGRDATVVCGARQNGARCFGHISKLQPGEIFVLTNGGIKLVDRFVR